MKSPENRTVLVDMDGVLADFDGRVQGVLANEFPEVPLPKIRKNFYIHQDLPPEFEPIIRGITSRPGFFTELEPIDYSLEAWARLIDAGYTPRICSAPLRKNPTCVEDKISWLEDHFVPVFGHWVIDTAIIDKKKYAHDGLVLVDDRPEIEGSNEASWRHVVFDQTYNRESSTPYRLTGWRDPLMLSILEEIGNSARPLG